MMTASGMEVTNRTLFWQWVPFIYNSLIKRLSHRVPNYFLPHYDVAIDVRSVSRNSGRYMYNLVQARSHFPLMSCKNEKKVDDDFDDDEVESSGFCWSP